MSGTARTMHPLVGTSADLQIEDYTLLIHVVILDVRERYGRTDYLVCPVAGNGQKWVSADRVNTDPGTCACVTCAPARKA